MNNFFLRKKKSYDSKKYEIEFASKCKRKRNKKKKSLVPIIFILNGSGRE